MLLTIIFMPAHSQTIRGKVYDTKTGEPMTGATVSLEHTRFTVAVRLDGTFAFRDLPAGKYEVITSMVVYQKGKETGVQVGSGGPINQVVRFMRFFSHL